MSYVWTDEDRATAREGINEMRPLVEAIRDQFTTFLGTFAGDEERAFAATVGYVNDLISSGQLDRNCAVGMMAFAARRLHYHVPLMAPSTMS